jgi:hypothetical protein
LGVAGEPGRGEGFARGEPDSEVRAGNQTTNLCTRGCLHCLVRDTKQPLHVCLPAPRYAHKTTRYHPFLSPSESQPHKITEADPLTFILYLCVTAMWDPLPLGPHGSHSMVEGAIADDLIPKTTRYHPFLSPSSLSACKKVDDVFAGK